MVNLHSVRPAAPAKITAEDLANELLWLRIDQNYLIAEKKKVRNVSDAMWFIYIMNINRGP